MGAYVLAHDLGTTGNKATLYDREGALVGSAFEPYQTHYPHPGWAEQNPEDWWRAVCTSSRRLLTTCQIAGCEVAGISFSGQMMGCVPLGRDGRALRAAIIWADQRAVEQERWLAERVSPADVYRITGHRLSPSYSLCKLLWVRSNAPDVYQVTHKFVHAKDAIVARLTGAFVTDVSDASGMNLLDLQSRGWSERILEAAELEPELLPDLHESLDVVGEVQRSVADEIGVPAGTPVVIGGGDGPCAAAGAGVVSAGSAYNYIGSSSWIAMASPEPIFDRQQRTFTFAHIVPDMFMPTGTMQAAGASYQWARDQLCPVEVAAAAALGCSPYELMNAEAERSPLGANGLLFLPYLMGERSPRWNPRARGAFIGLSVRHSRADMLRATLEGVAMNLRVILDALREQGAQIDAMRVIGGGARSQLWLQILANVYGVPVQRLAVLEEATSMGAAMAAGIGIGLYPGFEAIADKMNRVEETIEPQPEARAAYDALGSTFEDAYEALAPVYDRMAQIETRLGGGR